MTQFITLSWPHRHLSPNSRKDRRQTAGIRKAYRQEAWALAMNAKLDVGRNAHLDILFCPPDYRKRDLDNMLASIKSALDGIADATCRDDSGWQLTIRKGGVIKGGLVKVTILPPFDSIDVQYLELRGEIT